MRFFSNLQLFYSLCSLFPDFTDNAKSLCDVFNRLICLNKHIASITSSHTMSTHTHSCYANHVFFSFIMWHIICLLGPPLMTRLFTAANCFYVYHEASHGACYLMQYLVNDLLLTQLLLSAHRSRSADRWNRKFVIYDWMSQRPAKSDVDSLQWPGAHF